MFDIVRKTPAKQNLSPRTHPSDKVSMTLVSLVVFSGMLFAAVPGVHAQTNAISEGYATQDRLVSGALVSLQAGNQTKVDIASTENQARLFGVAVSSSQARIALSNGGQSVQVITSGTVSVQVGTINGAIHSGDYLTASPIKGVAMRATNTGKVIGVAQKDFTENSMGTDQPVTTKNGSKTVRLGSIPVSLQVQEWTPSQKNDVLIANARMFLSSLTGKHISGTQAFFSVALAIMTTLIGSIVIYSAVSASVYSIGRNPLSKHTVHRSLIAMLLLATIIFVGGISVIYLILEK